MTQPSQSAIEEAIGEPIVKIYLGSLRFDTLSGKACFLKAGPSSRAYQCEANGLREIAKSEAIRTPRVIASAENFLVTEYIASGKATTESHILLGRQLAHMHRTQANYFGFYEDNFIGDNPQPNIPGQKQKDNWTAFYWNNRLMFQYRMAEKKGLTSVSLQKGFNRLESRIEELLTDSLEPPTLLHGDLWSGNYLYDETGAPVLIDPAVYYGHREADLAMTKVFGGFSPLFYKAYQEEFPLKEGWEQREGLYKLYHILNHLNLFGSSYLHEAEGIVSQY